MAYRPKGWAMCLKLFYGHGLFRKYYDVIVKLRLYYMRILCFYTARIKTLTTQAFGKYLWFYDLVIHVLSTENYGFNCDITLWEEPLCCMLWLCTLLFLQWESARRSDYSGVLLFQSWRGQFSVQPFWNRVACMNKNI